MSRSSDLQEVPRKFVSITAAQRWRRIPGGFEPDGMLMLFAIADDGTAWAKSENGAMWQRIEPLPES